MAYTAALMEPSLDVDKLSYEIFSILESKFLFPTEIPPKTPPSKAGATGKVRILSIDAGGDLLAAVSLARLEASLRKRCGDPSAKIADFFDVAAGSGAGGVLVSMLFTRGPDGRPLFSADEALQFLAKNRRRRGIFREIFRRRSGWRFGRIFSDATLRDTVKPMLIPCYDLATGAPFLFSRADAVEADGYDFLVREVCAATCADPSAGAVRMRSVDGRTRIASVGGGLAMGNPTAAAITHVLNNKQEFPLAAGVEDLLVLSLGGEVEDRGGRGVPSPPSTAEYMRIAGEGVRDMVDQAVGMAFGNNRTANYVRIESNRCSSEIAKKKKSTTAGLEAALEEQIVESVLFREKKISEQTNSEKLELFSGQLIKEHEVRRWSTMPTVVIKQVMSPRTSSATVSTTASSTTSSSL